MSGTDSRLRGGVVTYPRRRWIAPVLVVVLAVGLVAGVGAHRLYHDPALDPLTPQTPVDAIVALGGVPASATYAQQLVREGLAPVLVISDPYPGGVAAAVHTACRSRPAAYRVVCFAPKPATTRGESQAIEMVARANGWDRIAVVTPVFHVSRARMIVGRCYRGTLLMVRMPLEVSAATWAYQYVYQSAGYLKAALRREC